MSLLVSLLGWTKLPPWVLELLAVVLVAVGVWLYGQHVSSQLVSAGKAEQRLEDQKALDRLKADTAKQQQILDARAKAAEVSYQNEKRESEEYRRTHPLTSAVLLCQQPPHRGGPDLHATIGAKPGTAAGAAAAGVLQPLPAPDTQLASDRLRLLDALAALADSTAGQVREFQRR